MAISEHDVRHVALLARLALTNEQVQHLARELSSILDHIGEIQALDLDGVEPTSHPFPVRNVMRRDEVRPGLSRDLALKNAPEARDGAFVIPRIVGAEEGA
ncbi:MAG: Asp-tRNA(Asn)/Glu-tRNA(Gln) amidotransferase subunit GatC [Coriobacteriia bacterium]|nr:Asp-tRNA(Asn)/Glu-tRNA(Gln) amidotransferase subunit GatC [Coriobacteriia bacterium]